MGFRNTETRLHRPETGKPLTRSWTDAVTNNLNHESTTPGGFSEGPNLNPSHPSPYINPVTLRVKNHTNAPQEMFSVLKITTPEETNPNAFPHILRSQQNAIYGETPTGDCHESVAITTYYMDPETELPCIVSGPSPVKILFETEESLTFPFAIPIYGDTTKLKASPFGRIKILWHEETQQTPTCSQPVVLYSWVNLGIQCEWSFWKLKADLACCSGALAQLCDECGAVINEDCPIEAMIYAPPGQTLCSCEDSCAMWKAGDIVPALWYEYLCKWVTIPNFQANLEEQELEVVTGLQMTGGVITPSQDYVAVVTDVIVDTDKITLCDTLPTQPYCLSGDIALTDATASGPLSVTGSIGSQQNPVKLDVISDCPDVTLEGSITTEDDVTLTGTMTGTAPVTVNLSGVEFDVTGACSGTATGVVTTSGTANVAGTCQIDNATLPTLTVTGNVNKTSQAEPVTLSGGSPQTFLTGATLTKPTLTLTPTSLTIPATTGSVSGTLGAVSLSGLTVTLDLSDIFDTETVVKDDSFSFTGCTLSWDTVEAVVLKSGADLSHVTATLSGTIAAGTSFSGNADLRTGATPVTINNPSGWNDGGLSTSTGSVTVPTTATLDTQKLSVTGTAAFPQNTQMTGTCSASGNVSASGNASLTVAGTISGKATGTAEDTATGTATLNTQISVSGPLEVENVIIEGALRRTCPEYVNLYVPSVTLSSTQDVSLPVSGTISDTRECYVDMPTTLCLEEGAIDVRHGRFPLPSVDLTGATISGVTSTIKVLGCKECPEPEEEEEPNA